MTSLQGLPPTTLPTEPSLVLERSAETLTINGGGLTIDSIASVVGGMKVRLSEDPKILRGIQASCDFIERAVESSTPIYGVNTCFGGMADQVIPKEMAAELQSNLLWSHKAGTGARLSSDDVRAGMLLRANSLSQGISALRPEILRRFETFLNAGVTPHVHEFGSIGASGDQVPLAYVAGALIGLDAHFRVDFQGESMDALSALARLGLSPISLAPKEGLALINGTSMTAGIAANCVHRARTLLALTMGTHALFLQGLRASNQSFHPFIHAHKPHPGQGWAAERMLELTKGSLLMRDELDGHRNHHDGELIQDRYSVRCLPQFLGPIVEGLEQISRQVEVEANSVTDNPLVDSDLGAVYHGGNFLAQYVAMGMDQLRYYIGMMAKHLDVQIALLVSPEFNNGLPASLTGNPARKINTGLKALQLTANGIMPMLSFYGNSIADRFPTHAEQFNQNINSQGYGSANLTRRSLDIFEQYLAIALMFAVQAVDLRTYAFAGHYDARRCLSAPSARLYEAVRVLVGRPPSADRPYLFDDREQFLDLHVARISSDLAARGEIVAALGETTAR